MHPKILLAVLSSHGGICYSLTFLLCLALTLTRLVSGPARTTFTASWQLLAVFFVALLFSIGSLVLVAIG
jgi:hypothetical protein